MSSLTFPIELHKQEIEDSNYIEALELLEFQAGGHTWITDGSFAVLKSAVQRNIKTKPAETLTKPEHLAETTSLLMKGFNRPDTFRMVLPEYTLDDNFFVRVFARSSEEKSYLISLNARFRRLICCQVEQNLDGYIAFADPDSGRESPIYLYDLAKTYIGLVMPMRFTSNSILGKLAHLKSLLSAEDSHSEPNR